MRLLLEVNDMLTVEVERFDGLDELSHVEQHRLLDRLCGIVQGAEAGLREARRAVDLGLEEAPTA